MVYGNKMYKVKSKTVVKEDLETLDDAMEYAKSLNEFVTITGGELEIVGMFGVDGVKDGKCPSGDDYTWKKRRK